MVVTDIYIASQSSIKRLSLSPVEQSYSHCMKNMPKNRWAWYWNAVWKQVGMNNKLAVLLGLDSTSWHWIYHREVYKSEHWQEMILQGYTDSLKFETFHCQNINIKRAKRWHQEVRKMMVTLRKIKV